MPPKKNNQKKPSNKKKVVQAPKSTTKKKQPAKRTAPVLKMSPCAWKYARAIAAPSSPSAAGACIPDGQMTTSQKVQANFEFSGSTGTQNLGWIFPVCGITSDSVAAYYTNSAYPQPVSAAMVPFSADNTFITGVSSISPTELPYLNANMITTNGDQPGIVGRLVSVEVEVSYAGTDLNKGGRVYCYADPTHMSTSAMTIFDIGNRKAKSSERWDKTCKLVLTPVNVQECNPSRSETLANTNANAWSVYPFCSGDYDWASTYRGSTAYTNVGTSTVQVGIPTAIIAIQSAAASQPFHCKMTYNIEYGGVLASASLSPNPIDLAGAALVMRAAKNMFLSASEATARWNTLLKQINALVAEATPVAEMAAMSI